MYDLEPQSFDAFFRAMLVWNDKKRRCQGTGLEKRMNASCLQNSGTRKAVVANSWKDRQVVAASVVYDVSLNKEKVFFAAARDAYQLFKADKATVTQMSSLW